MSFFFLLLTFVCLHCNKLFVYILADWQSGGSCMVVPTVKPEDVAGLFPKGKLSRPKKPLNSNSINQFHEKCTFSTFIVKRMNVGIRKTMKS